MGWASAHIAQLQAGETVQFRPRGHSMQGYVAHNQLVTLAPVDLKLVTIGDVVLCTVNGHQYLHMVKAKHDREFLIGNARGGINGWTTQIHGLLVAKEPLPDKRKRR